MSATSIFWSLHIFSEQITNKTVIRFVGYVIGALFTNYQCKWACLTHLGTTGEIHFGNLYFSCPSLPLSCLSTTLPPQPNFVVHRVFIGLLYLLSLLVLLWILYYYIYVCFELSIICLFYVEKIFFSCSMLLLYIVVLCYYSL